MSLYGFCISQVSLWLLFLIYSLTSEVLGNTLMLSDFLCNCMCMYPIDDVSSYFFMELYVYIFVDDVSLSVFIIMDSVNIMKTRFFNGFFHLDSKYESLIAYAIQQVTSV